MKKIVALLIFFATANHTYAQPPAVSANPGDSFGEKITVNNAIAPDVLTQNLNTKDTVDAKISAKVLDVCPKKGCWMQVELADKSKMFVKFKDYAFFVPLEIKDKNVVLEGIAFHKTTSIAELKHYAEDAKKSKAEIDAITEPKQELRFLANGVLVVK